MLQRFERYFELIQAEQVGLRTYMDQKIGALDEKIDALRAEFLSEIHGEIGFLRTEMGERFQSVDEQVRTLTLRAQRVETAVDASRKEVGQLSHNIGRVETALIELNGRIDQLGDDMRQRFRGVNERLVVIEKRSAA